MNLREAAQMALETCTDVVNGWESLAPLSVRRAAIESLDALRAALAEPQTTHWEGCEEVHPECRKTEPVAWISEGGDVSRSRRYMDEMGFKCEPLYAAPTPRKPLTEEEIWALYYALPSDDFERSDRIDFARAIERAHGIGEQT